MKSLWLHPVLENQRRQTRMALVLLWLLLWSVNYLVERMAPGTVGPHLLALGEVPGVHHLMGAALILRVGSGQPVCAANLARFSNLIQR